LDQSHDQQTYNTNTIETDQDPSEVIKVDKLLDCESSEHSFNFKGEEKIIDDDDLTRNTQGDLSSFRSIGLDASKIFE
jgi:hypothetical protein